MTTEEADIILDVLDNLELLDASLLEYEKGFTVGAPNSSLVHILFRYAHNSKGALSLIGRESAMGLIHELESNLDGIRNARRRPNSAFLDAASDAISALRNYLRGEDSDREFGTIIGRLVASGDEVVSDSPRTPSCPTQTSIENAPRGVSYPHHPDKYVYEVTKLITPTVSRSEFDSLPIFSTLREIGEILRCVPNFEQLDRNVSEVALTIVVATTMDDGEFSCNVFDPYIVTQQPERIVEVTPFSSSNGDEGEKLRVLVVDDEFVNRSVLTKAFSGISECDVAVNGREALVAYLLALEEKRPYRLVCLDIMMPEMDGRTCLRMLRKIEEDRQFALDQSARVIMTTALDDSKSILGSFREGCEAYVTKPLDLQKLKEKARSLGLPV